MDRSIALRGLGTLALCAAMAGCASLAPVPYSEMASSAYMAPDRSDASGRVPYRSDSPLFTPLADLPLDPPLLVEKVEAT